MIIGAFTLPYSAMSEEQLKAFMEAVKADAGLQEKLNAAADADAVVAIAKAAGFVISAEELQRYQTEISEEVLEAINGGQCQGNGTACRLTASLDFNTLGCRFGIHCG